MSPFHHHLEMRGWAEITIVVRMWIIAGLLAVSGVGLSTSSGSRRHERRFAARRPDELARRLEGPARRRARALGDRLLGRRHARRARRRRPRRHREGRRGVRAAAARSSGRGCGPGALDACRASSSTSRPTSSSPRPGFAPRHPLIRVGAGCRHRGLGRHRARLASARQGRARRRHARRLDPRHRHQRQDHDDPAHRDDARRGRAARRPGAATSARRCSTPCATPRASTCSSSSSRATSSGTSGCSPDPTRCRRTRACASTSPTTTSSGTGRSRPTATRRRTSTTTPASRASTTRRMPRPGAMVEDAEVIEGARAIGFDLGVPGPERPRRRGRHPRRPRLPRRPAHQRARAHDGRRPRRAGPRPPRTWSRTSSRRARSRARSRCRPRRSATRCAASGSTRTASRSSRSSTGVTWVDDSKATNPHAAASSLAAYPGAVWIVGGLLKGVDIADLVAGARRARRRPRS